MSTENGDEPLPFSNLGKSSLFGDYESVATAQPVIDSSRDAFIEDNDEISEDIYQFTSSNKKVIRLNRKKKNIGSNEEKSILNSENTENNIEWKDYDSYGININMLLDKITATSDEQTKKPNENDDGDGMLLNHDSNTKHHSNQKPRKLWVEKWRPKSFLDLVGNERTNRRILGWLRQWSYAVFKEELVPFRPTYKNNNNNNNNNNKNNIFTNNNTTTKASNSTENEPKIDVDPFQRPQRKILLIHGPPGIGKTSVAHVVAKQAGYSVSEINASDERAGQLVKYKVQNTLFNHTFNEKPVCLIADEIDGAVESGFVRILLDIIYKDQRATNKLKYSSNSKNNNNSSSKLSRSRKKENNKKTSNVLLRPIIAICNNLYAPALEKLRPHCEVISFKRPSDTALQERLIHISKKEHLDFSVKILNNLIDLAQGDVRSCINNLQFMASNKTLEPPPELEKNKVKNKENKNLLESSQKDTSMLWFKLVNRIFKRDPHVDLRTQHNEILRDVEMNGNYDRIVQGCFTLYPTVKYSDIGVKKPAEISDWLYFHDIMFKSIFEHNGELVRYSSITPLVFFEKFSDIANREDVRIKNMEYENREKYKLNMDIINSISRNISSYSPRVAEFLSKNALVFDVLPYLDNMFSTDLLRMRDIKTKNKTIENLLELLKIFQLNLVEMESGLSNSRTILGISPPIDKIVVFDSKQNKDIITKRPQNLNLLLAKSEEEKVKKRHFNQVLQERADLEENKTKNKKSKTSGSSTIDFFKNQYDSINHTQMETTANNNTITKDSNSNNNNNNNKSSGIADHARIWVKYKAGFSNAVRKNVTWETLWE